MLLRALRLSDHQTAPLQVRYELRGPRSCSRQFRKNLLRAAKVRKCLDDVRELVSARSHSRPGVEKSVLLPSWIGLAETTLLLAPSPIIVWATIQNSYNSANSRPRAPQHSVINNSSNKSKINGIFLPEVGGGS